MAIEKPLLSWWAFNRYPKETDSFENIGRQKLRKLNMLISYWIVPESVNSIQVYVFIVEIVLESSWEMAGDLMAKSGRAAVFFRCIIKVKYRTEKTWLFKILYWIRMALRKFALRIKKASSDYHCTWSTLFWWPWMLRFFFSDCFLSFSILLWLLCKRHCSLKSTVLAGNLLQQKPRVVQAVLWVLGAWKT